MTDLATWQPRGPVRTLRTDIAEWDPERGEWRESRHTNDVTFDASGHAIFIESHNSDGSIARQARVYKSNRLIEEQYWTNDGARTSRIHSYDAAGRCTEAVEVQPDGRRRTVERYQYDDAQRPTKNVFLDIPAPALGAFSVGFGIEEDSEHCGGLCAVGYGDGGDRIDTVTFHNAAGDVIFTTEFARDEHGRVTRQDVYYGSPNAFPLFSAADVPEEQRESFRAMIDAVMPNRTFASVLYEYDLRGRKIACTRHFTILSEHRTTYTYDDHDNPILERSESSSQKGGFDPNGTLRTEMDRTERHDVQLEYRYDDQGNWVERIVSGRTDASQPFQRTNVEWRTIAYFGTDDVLT